LGDRVDAPDGIYVPRWRCWAVTGGGVRGTNDRPPTV